MITALVLAAGDSSRMGRPKALLQYKGSSFLGKICSDLKEAGISDIVVVLGSHKKEILSAWRPVTERIAYNETPELGQIASVRAGLKLVPADSEGVMICLVDQPTIKSATYKEIYGFWALHKEEVVIPRCPRPDTLPYAGQGAAPPYKRGHPIIIPRRYFNLCQEGPVEKGLHWVTHHKDVKVADLNVADINIIRDFDTPEDYKKLSDNF